MAAIRFSMTSCNVGSITVSPVSPTFDTGCHVLRTRHMVWIDNWIYWRL
jgi:hypothetical protein